MALILVSVSVIITAFSPSVLFLVLHYNWLSTVIVNLKNSIACHFKHDPISTIFCQLHPKYGFCLLKNVEKILLHLDIDKS